MSEETVTTTAAETPVTTIARIGEHEGKSITLTGWLYNLRESGKLLFPIFRDGSGTIQGIVPKAAVSPEVFETTTYSLETITSHIREYAFLNKGLEITVRNERPEADDLVIAV